MIGPHQNQPVLSAGAPIGESRAAMIMIHGRGATASNILALVGSLNHPEFSYVAPQAAHNTWYPYSFLSPIADNEPGISSGMQVITDLLERLEAAGIPAERTMLLGFSQGACLSSEYIARHATRYGGLAALSGGLIGPVGTPRDYSGSLGGTPAFFGCSDIDPHIPKERVEESANVLGLLGANVELRLYEGMGHLVNDDEIEHVRSMMSKLIGD